MSDSPFDQSPLPAPAAAAPPYTDYANAAAPPVYGALPPRQDEYDAVPPQSQGERVLNTFFAPSKTSADIRRNRSWWMPFLLLAVFGILFGAVAMKRVGPQTMAENAMRSNPAQAERMQNAPPEQRAQMLKFTAISMQVGVYAGAVFLLIFAAVLALLMWVGCNFILGGSSTYPGMFAVSMYAFLPGLITYVLIIVTLFVGDPETFNINNPVGTNIGYYLPPESPAFLKSLLTSFDVIFLWEMVLLGLGGAIVARLKPVKGISLVLGAWFLIVLIKAGVAAI